MTEAHLQEFEIVSTYLIHWNQLMGQTVECFKDGQDISNVDHLGQFHFPRPPLYMAFSGAALSGLQIVTFGAKW